MSLKLRIPIYSPPRALFRKIVRWSFGLVIASVALLHTVGFQALGAEGQSLEAVKDLYVLGSGDRIKVVVFGHNDLSGEFEVDGSGNISLPLINEIKATGKTIRGIEQAIIKKLKPDFLINPRVSVDVMNYRPFYIIGQVKSPGSYPYVAGMTVVNAVALAGGYTYRAREGRVLITSSKDGKQRPAGHTTPVLPGDVIEVPERLF